MTSHEADPQITADYDLIAATAHRMAQQQADDITELLRLLRFLEKLHREIREDIFQAALPTSRQQLHKLLREIETEGGWPYIPRMRLRAFLENLGETDYGEG
jgi:hypothetical protein